jgi:SAM-dependent methyltransferase
MSKWYIRRSNQLPHTTPNPKSSTPEHERLERQAECLSELMNNEIFHAPLAPTIHKVLDMGCGTGTVTHTAASKFPGAQVYGLDLSPVPNIRKRLPNVEYIQGDLFELTNANKPDPRFERGSFDYIFSRLLIAGMTDWKGYVERCVDLSKPGVCFLLDPRSPRRMQWKLTPKATRAGSRCTKWTYKSIAYHSQ